MRVVVVAGASRGSGGGAVGQWARGGSWVTDGGTLHLPSDTHRIPGATVHVNRELPMGRAR